MSSSALVERLRWWNRVMGRSVPSRYCSFLHSELHQPWLLFSVTFQLPGFFLIPCAPFSLSHSQAGRSKGCRNGLVKGWWGRTFSCPSPTSSPPPPSPPSPCLVLPFEGDSLGPCVFCFGFCFVNSSWQSLCTVAVSCPATGRKPCHCQLIRQLHGLSPRGKGLWGSRRPPQGWGGRREGK